MGKGKGEKLWQGRTSGEVNDITVEMGESISLDIALYREDLFGSAVHARMLQRIGLLTQAELDELLGGLRRIETEISAGELELRPELEDIHTHIEQRLIELVGDTARRLHTARSRNDQVAVDTHLFVRRACREIQGRLIELGAALLKRAGENIDAVVPGYTHMQVAQPVRLSHHLLAHFWSVLRDVDRFSTVRTASGRLPLGSGAMAGVNYATDREFLGAELGFESVHPNSMEAVAGRDHILDFLYACAAAAIHASRLCEEIILWNSVEFSFITLPDALTTGSSIMPQKKNPDLAELARGKTGRLIGNLTNLCINLKGLPFTYNRDLQEDRFPLLDSREQILLVLRALTAMVEGMVFHPERMSASLKRGYATATDLADALVLERQVPFREAHHLAGRAVARCVELGCTLDELDAGERAAICEHFTDEEFFRGAVDLSRSADKKISYGGTARPEQERQLQEARAAVQLRRGEILKTTEYKL